MHQSVHWLNNQLKKESFLRLHRIEIFKGNESLHEHESCLHGLSVVWTEVLVKSQRRKEN